MTEIALSVLFLTALVLALTLAVLAARRVMQPSLPVTVTVNGTRKLPGTTGQKLLPILTGAGIPVPSGCAGAGTCGLCRVTVTGGGGAPLPTETARLSRAEIRGGLRLACQVVVREALSVRLPDALLSAETLACPVVSTRMVAPLIREIVLAVPANADFRPRAGSFVQVAAPPYRLDFAAIEVAPEHEATWRDQGWRRLTGRSAAAVTRAYSLANRPQDEGRIVLNIRLAVPPPGAGAEVPPGIVSSWLFGLRPGDTVEVSGPFGDFGARDTGREMVLIGGGVGMAPLRAIVHDQLDRLGSPRRISYWFGARSGADAFYVDEFRDLERRHPNFRFTLALSDPAPGDETGHETGFIHDVAHRAYLRDHPAPWDCEYYLCGPPLMIQAVRRMLDGIGVEPDAIFFDDFGT